MCDCMKEAGDEWPSTNALTTANNSRQSLIHPLFKRARIEGAVKEKMKNSAAAPVTQGHHALPTTKPWMAKG